MRRIASLLFAMAVSVGVITTAAAPAGAAAPTLAEYAVFGLNGVQIGNTSTVVGIVGGRFNSPFNGYAVQLLGNAKIVADTIEGVPGDARSGGNVNLLNNADIQNTLTRAPGTSLVKAASAHIGTSVVADPQLPALPPPTPIPGGCPTAGPSSSGANGATKSIGPGTYGTLAYGGQFTLNLTGAGNYYFNSITAGNGMRINAVPGVKLFLCGAFDVGTVIVGPASLLAPDFEVEAQSNDIHNAFSIGGASSWIGNVFTPNGGIHIGNSSSVQGSLHAGGVVDLEHSTTVNPPQPPPPPVEHKDATLFHAAKNLNNGANNSLRVRYQLSSIIGFDVAGVNFAAVKKATLVLTVCNTPGNFNFCPDPPSQWPAAGGINVAQRLADGYENWGSGLPPTAVPPEGNGNNFPIMNNPHGTGAGVTWNCPIDTDIANEARDCKKPWGGGQAIDGAARPSTTIVNNMADGTKVSFDVTLDVKQGLGPKDKNFMTWFVRKPGGTGFISYYSFQGAGAKANPSLAPQLVLEF